MSDKQKNFIIRTITSVVFVVILVSCIVLHIYSFALLFAIISMMTTWEFCSIMNKQLDIQVNRFICTIATLFLFAATFLYNTGFFSSTLIFVPYLVTIIYLLVSQLYTKSTKDIYNLAFAFMSQIYIALPIAMLSVLAGFSLWLMNDVKMHWVYPLSVFIFLWCNDAGAYCVGSLIGKHKLFPRISPGKSWEGSIGGAVIAIVISQVIAYYIPFIKEITGIINYIIWAGLALVIVIFGTYGDLVESMLKRRLQIKDSGNILPGHGGMLDRFDSTLLAVPAAVVYIDIILININNILNK